MTATLVQRRPRRVGRLPRVEEHVPWPVCPQHDGAFLTAKVVGGVLWHYCTGVGWHDVTAVQP